MASYHEGSGQARVPPAAGLQPKGWRIRWRRPLHATDGPSPRPRSWIAGYTVIQVRSAEEVMEWSRRFPNPARSRRHRLRDRGAAPLRAEDFQTRRPRAERMGGGRFDWTRPRSVPSRPSGASSARASSRWRAWARCRAAEDMAQDALIAALDHWPRKAFLITRGLADDHRQTPRTRSPALRPEPARKGEARRSAGPGGL